MINPSIKVTHLVLLFLSTFTMLENSFATTASSQSSKHKKTKYVNHAKHEKSTKTVKKVKYVTHAEQSAILPFLPIYDVCPQTEKLTQFYQTVLQNSPLSYADNHLCINNLLSFSGKISMDFRWYDRYGSPFNKNLWGVGLRPMFGPRASQFWASLNEASLFVDARINQWMLADMSLTYVNGNVAGRTFDHYQSDWRSVWGSPASLKVDEAYLTIAKPEITPFYVRIGRQYSIFGDYKPYPLTYSLPQLLEQSRTGAFVAGAVLPSGFYGAVNWSLSKQSLNDINAPAGSSLTSGGSETDHLDRNYGAKLGYQLDACVKDQKFHLNTNVSWLDDIRDVDYLNEIWFDADSAASDAQTSLVTLGQAGFMKSQGGVAFHADSNWGPFGLGGDYVTALGNLNPISSVNSRIYSWAVDGNISFVLPINMFGMCGMPSWFDVSYQGSGNAQPFGIIVTNPFAFSVAVSQLGPFGSLLPLQIGNVLPQRRWQFTYTVNAMKNVTVSAQYVHDLDFPPTQSGTGLTSSLALLNVTAQF